MKEEWKEIDGYEGMYLVSSLGRVWVAESYVVANGKSYRKKPHILKDVDNSRGYRYVTISIRNKGIRKNHYVHKLVAAAFLDNSENLPEVNHKDGNKANNNLDNLEWCSKSYNLRHALSTGLKKSGGNVPNAIPVVNINDHKIFSCIAYAGKYYGIKYCLLKEGIRRNTSYRGIVTFDQCLDKYPVLYKRLKLDSYHSGMAVQMDWNYSRESA